MDAGAYEYGGSLPAPRVTGVEVNRDVASGPGSVDHGGDGIGRIDVSFDEPAIFAERAVVLHIVSFLDGIEHVTRLVEPASVTGSGSDTMTTSSPALKSMASQRSWRSLLKVPRRCLPSSPRCNAPVAFNVAPSAVTVTLDSSRSA